MLQDVTALIWSNIDVKASNSSPIDGSKISAFIKNLDHDNKALLLLGCLPRYLLIL